MESYKILRRIGKYGMILLRKGQQEIWSTISNEEFERPGVVDTRYMEIEGETWYFVGNVRGDWTKP
jgi:hypothetical protein